MMERQTARLRRGSYRPLFFLPNGKSCSSCVSLLVSGNGLILPSAEGRARLSPKRQGMHLRLRFPFWVLQHGSVRHGFACTPGRKISSPVDSCARRGQRTLKPFWGTFKNGDPFNPVSPAVAQRTLSETRGGQQHVVEAEA